MGYENEKSGQLELYVQIRRENCLKATCTKQDLTDYLNAWESLPPLKPPVALSIPDTATGADAAEVKIDDGNSASPQP
jgi:hypothetical protein